MKVASEERVAELQRKFQAECLPKDVPHEFEIICESGEYGPGVTQVVRWCPTCGAVVVDTDVDNRTNPGSIRWPEIARFNQVAFGKSEV